MLVKLVLVFYFTISRKQQERVLLYSIRPWSFYDFKNKIRFEVNPMKMLVSSLISMSGYSWRRHKAGNVPDCYEIVSYQALHAILKYAYIWKSFISPGEDKQHYCILKEGNDNDSDKDVSMSSG